MRARAALAACALGALGASAQTPRAGGRITDSILQIGIARKARLITLSPQGRFSVIDQATGRTQTLESGQSYLVASDAQQRISLGSFVFSGATRLLPGGPEDTVLVAGKKYRGNFIFKPSEGGTVTVVDEVGIEDYLRGVLPHEMSPDWPLEALKAQAVVARTFALTNLGKYAGAGYDLSDDVGSQVYSGIAAPSKNVEAAVSETAGEVLQYQGSLLGVFFHSCCGGSTADPKDVWGRPAATPRPLRGVKDRYCRRSPHYQWSAYFANEDLLAALAAHGRDGARLNALRLGARSRGGLLKTFRLQLDGRRVDVRANDLRNWMGPSDIKSTQIWRVVERKRGYEFVGRGFGHGVGLCQWGARAQADAGRDYRKILSFYFPGAAIAHHVD